MTAHMYRGGKYVPGVMLVDLEGNPVNPNPIINVSEGGVDTTGLAQESTQAEIVQRLDTLALQQQEARPVVVENPEMPLPTGASTSNLQTTQINRLNDVYALLGSGISVILENDEALNVAVASLPLPSGASTSAKQDALLAALQAGVSVNVANALSAAVTSLPPVQIAANQSLGVTGTVNIGNTVPVSGSVNVGNFPSTQPVSGTVAVSSIGTPVPITDNGQSITVDGSVAVSGPVEISNYPATQPVSVASVPVHGVTQSGAWEVGLNEPVEISNFPATQPVSGTVAATQSGAWSTAISNFPATQPVSLTTVPTHPVTQSGTWNVNSTMTSPTATAGALTNFRSTAVLAAPQAVKTSAGRLFNYHFANPNNSWVYVHLYNTLTANTTVGTTVPLVSLGVPANSVLDGAWMFSYNFSTAITIAVTATATGTTAPATGLIADLGYV